MVSIEYCKCAIERCNEVFCIKYCCNCTNTYHAVINAAISGNLTVFLAFAPRNLLGPRSSSSLSLLLRTLGFGVCDESASSVGASSIAGACAGSSSYSCAKSSAMSLL